jgi:flagellin
MQAWEVVTTKYNGQYLMANIGEPGSLGLSLDLQIGAESENVLHVDWLDAISGVGAGLKYSYPGTLETMLTENASQAVQDTAEAIDAIAGARSEFGAIANRLESAYRTASNLIVNTVSAQGRIRDTDFATESAESVAAQMLMQSSSAMLKQSGSVKQLAMSLIQ